MTSVMAMARRKERLQTTPPRGASSRARDANKQMQQQQPSHVCTLYTGSLPAFTTVIYADRTPLNGF